MKTWGNGKMSREDTAIVQSAIEHLQARGFENIIILATKKDHATGKNNGIAFGRKVLATTAGLLAIRLVGAWLDAFLPEESPLHEMWSLFSKAMRLEIDDLREAVGDEDDAPSHQK